MFLGEWCLLYARKEAWERRRYEIVPNHWDDRAKLKRDHDYLSGLRESLLTHLADTLNRHHHIDRPIRYWRMVLDSWLVTYVAVMFDRWEYLRVAFERYGTIETLALPPLSQQGPPRGYVDFVHSAAESHVFNHHIFLRIIESAYLDRCTIRRQSPAPQQQELAKQRPEIKPVDDSRGSRRGALTAVRLLDASLGKLFSRNKVTFFTSYFPLQALVRINLALRQVPRLYLREFDDVFVQGDAAHHPAARDHASLTISRLPMSTFEAFLTEQLSRDLPSAYVEGFSNLREQALQIRISTRAICSANAHWDNELFKVWSAEQMNQGAKFVTMEHGSGIPALFDTMSFEEKISDRRTVWSVPYRPNHVRMPANKLVTRRFKSSRVFCSVISNEMPLYAYRAMAAAISGQTLESFRMVCELYSRLDPDVQQWFRVKPYANLGWNTAQRFRDRLGGEKVHDEPNYYRVLSQSRVVVCTYPQTTFAEAMTSGLPTLLLYPAHLWETIPEMDSLLKTLRAAGIVFDDPRAAAERLNLIWADPEKAWNEPTVKHARKEFFRYCVDIDQDWLNKWKPFLQHMSK